MSFLKRWCPWLFPVYWARVDINAKCPACGHHHGELKFLKDQKLVAHTCKVCGAMWGESPVLKAEAWLA